MDMYNKIDTAVIGKVWRRVAPESGNQGDGEPVLGMLCSFMDSAVYAKGMYELLAMKTRGSRESRELAELARQEAATLRRLETEYFLLTGDTHSPAKAHPSAPYLLRALRDAYAGEMENSRKYAAAAGSLPDGKLRETLYDLSARERGHAQTVRGIVERAM